MNKHKILALYLTSICGMTVSAQEAQEPDSLSGVTQLDNVEIVVQQSGRRKSRNSALNTDVITTYELKKAACCNLGESFTTNPSVDVSYNDAATGARQIKLLGLSGSYVQMLTENTPNLRGAAAPYGLGYIAGPWMKSIQISKGASSVKNGYESISGQINIEMLKPQEDQSFAANAYVNHMGKLEGNLTGNLHLSPHLSTGLLLHAEDLLTSHDKNGDGFIDAPKIRQVSAMNRWAWISDSYIFQAGVKYINEKRTSGEDSKHANHDTNRHLYNIGIETQRWEAFMKNAYIFDEDNGANIALILSGSLHDQDANYGHKLYDVDQKNFYASLMFERKYGELHSISTGLSFNYDYYDQDYRLTNDATLSPLSLNTHEGVGGGYAQYTFNNDGKLLAMAGVRYDYSSNFGGIVIPRIHLRWNPLNDVTIHGSIGSGHRTAHLLAENNYLLASSREIIIDDNLKREKAWNMGAGVGYDFQIGNTKYNVTGEYYYTRFDHQAIIDLDSDAHKAILRNSMGNTYSHTAQVELSIKPLKEMTITAAYRYTDVKENYGYGMVTKALTSKSKGLFTFDYAPMMGKWQFDASLAINGGGRMPTPYTTDNGSASWNARYKAFPSLNAQITKNFRHWSVYIGGENLTNYKQKNPIIGASDPWGKNFDSTMVYAPIDGAMIYVGFRYTFTKY
jgi:outer membrane receptor for ferrienterochelin and colicin